MDAGASAPVSHGFPVDLWMQVSLGVCTKPAGMDADASVDALVSCPSSHMSLQAAHNAPYGKVFKKPLFLTRTFIDF